MMNILIFTSIFILFHLCFVKDCIAVSWNWDRWWTYDGISGPDFWGLINPEWSLCNKGRRQSPIDIDPSRLLHDPNLRHLHIDKHKVNGALKNTGHSVLFSTDDLRNPVNVTGGPLSYRYQLTEAQLHYGLQDMQGSEHTVSGKAFPAELQVFGFNSQLYQNFSEAIDKAYGIIGISLLLQVGPRSDNEIGKLMKGAPMIKNVGESSPIEHLSLSALFPATPYYLTYEGSTTTPGCHETVTWILFNKPAYISKRQLTDLRQLRKGDSEAFLANNFRPPQKLHHRAVRTNIDFTNAGGNCPTMHKGFFYQANSVWFPS